MKLIITGATGFIGRNLAEGLQSAGLAVLATGRNKKIGAELQKRGIEFKAADLLDNAQLVRAFSPADCVIHCAARSGDWGSCQDFFSANVVGTRNVITACQENGIGKIIFISTPSVYFNGHDRFNIKESDVLPTRQATFYSKTKLICEQELIGLQRQGIEVIILRPRAVYGPYDNTFVPRILRMAQKGKLPLIAGGKAMIDITYIDNLLEAVRKCLEAKEDSWNQIYNISNGDPIAVKDWFRELLAVFDCPFSAKNVPEPLAMAIAGLMEFASRLPFGPKKPILTRFAVGYMAKSMTMSIDLAKDKIRYLPLVSNKQSFELYAKWCHDFLKKENI
jgi:nucleoside-diphosphate-sugar epimerase